MGFFVGKTKNPKFFLWVFCTKRYYIFCVKYMSIIVFKPTENVNKKEKELAKLTFQAFAPFVRTNVSRKVKDHQTGKKIYLTNLMPHDLEAFLADKANPDLRRRYFGSKFSASMVRQSLEKGTCYAYTSRCDKGLISFDFDAANHEMLKFEQSASQSHMADCKAAVDAIIAMTGDFGFISQSHGGYQLTFKAEYLDQHNELRAILTALQRSISHFLAANGFKGTFEIKGRPKGQVCRFPFNKPNTWDTAKLTVFQNTPTIKGIKWWQGLLDHVNSLLPKSEIVKSEKTSSYSWQAKFIKFCQRYKKRAIRLAKKIFRFVDQPDCKARVKRSDVAYSWLVHGFIFKFNGRHDNATAHNLIKMLWSYAYEQGIFKRAFNASRNKSVRNAFSKLGMLHWVQERYYFFTNGKGQCCKYGKTKKFSRFSLSGSSSSYIRELPVWKKPILIFKLTIDDQQRRAFELFCEKLPTYDALGRLAG